MTFNVNDMHAQLVGGGARPTLFEVELTNTNTALGLNLKNSKFMVHAASLPESTMALLNFHILAVRSNMQVTEHLRLGEFQYSMMKILQLSNLWKTGWKKSNQPYLT